MRDVGITASPPRWVHRRHRHAERLDLFYDLLRCARGGERADDLVERDLLTGTGVMVVPLLVEGGAAQQRGEFGPLRIRGCGQRDPAVTRGKGVEGRASRVPVA